MRPLPAPWCLLSALILLAPLASAADLKLDGVDHVYKRFGQDVSITVSGTPGAAAYLLLDLAPGPGQLFGATLPIGLEPGFSVLSLGPIPASGTYSDSVAMPVDPFLSDKTVYAVALLNEGGASFSAGARLTFVERHEELAGNPLGGFPWFERVAAFNAGSAVHVAVDPDRHPEAVGVTADVYVVLSKSAAEWDGNPSLVDVSGDGVDTVTFGASLLGNIVEVDAGSLSSAAGDGLGRGYDVVVDLDQDGLLGADDLIDGYGSDAGLSVVHDLTLPGPHTVVETIYSGGSFLGQDLYYPSNIASLGQLPVLVVSHGNGHNYQWYDHIGMHLASYGWIVMSHQNNTVPGIETASTTTLTNTDYLLGNLGTIAGGALAGHVDTDNIAWIGHSRGGEGVVRAYDRLVDGTYFPANFTAADIVFISSIAPTDFLGTTSATPHDVDYHLWVGGADADVTGCSSNDVAQSFHLLARAEQRRLSISLHGVGHGDFHASTGSVATGPCLVGKTNTHTIMRGYILPLMAYHQKGNVPAQDYLWRQWESFRPIGAPVSSSCVVVDLQLSESDTDGRFVVDDHQDLMFNLSRSSSGGVVSGTVANRAEGRMDDNNNNFTHDGAAFNGFTYCRSTDNEAGAVFEWNNAPAELRFAVVPAARNVRPYDALILRAAQQTRHPLTTAVSGDLTFSVSLVDRMGGQATVQIGTLGGGIEEPYNRSSCGTGNGWAAEFETITIRLTDFEADGDAVDLSNLGEIVLSFGPGAGSAQGRLGLDDLMFVRR